MNDIRWPQGPLVDDNKNITLEWRMFLLGQALSVVSMAGTDITPTVDIGTVAPLIDQVRQELETLPPQQVYAELIDRISQLESLPLPPPGTGMIIKDIQRGTITIVGAATTGTATITGVDTTKTELRMLGNRSDSVSIDSALCHIVLTNSTTITATRAAANLTCTVSWELTEWQ